MWTKEELKAAAIMELDELIATCKRVVKGMKDNREYGEYLEKNKEAIAVKFSEGYNDYIKSLKCDLPYDDLILMGGYLQSVAAEVMTVKV